VFTLCRDCDGKVFEDLFSRLVGSEGRFRAGASEEDLTSWGSELNRGETADEGNTLRHGLVRDQLSEVMTLAGDVGVGGTVSGRTITWQPNAVSGEWETSFQVLPMREGWWATNDVASFVYVDAFGAAAYAIFPVPYVQVDRSLANSTATATVSPTATPTPRTTLVSSIYLPVILAEHCTPDTSLADTLLVLDASNSMLEEIRPGYTKRDAAIAAASRFIDLLKPGDQAGVVSFNDTAVLEQGLTGDKLALRTALRRIDIDQFTRLDLGIAKARDELASSRHNLDNRTVLILLTDGKANPEPVETAIQEAELAKKARITLFVIGLGRPQDLDDGGLRQIASRAEFYYQTPDASTLATIYEEIAGVIPCPPEQFWGRR